MKRERSVVELLRWLELDGKSVRVIEGGELLEDVEGLPLGVEPNRISEPAVVGVNFDPSDWETLARFFYPYYRKAQK